MARVFILSFRRESYACGSGLTEEGSPVKCWLRVFWRLVAVLLLASWLPVTGPARASAAAPQGERRADGVWDWLFPYPSVLHSDLPAVIPGGESIGIQLHARGILVVGYHLVHRGKDAVSPGERADLQVGDIILTVNGRPAGSVDQVSRMISQAGLRKATLSIGYKRHGRLLTARIRPAYDEETGSYRIGLYIRDSASGVGTLTFYIPGSGRFGALGHVISDVDTGEAIEGEGLIVHAAVTSIDRGESGQPGEKRGLFVDEHRIVGKILENNAFGVFGVMTDPPDHGWVQKPIPVAEPGEVHTGPAQILTVVTGQKVEAFDAVIVKASRQSSADVKGLVIRVTDPALLKKTGGIVQGMSGSPILQDGKLAGAVTHVFVSDPAQGYGVYAAWMLQSALAKAASSHAVAS